MLSPVTLVGLCWHVWLIVFWWILTVSLGGLWNFKEVRWFEGRASCCLTQIFQIRTGLGGNTCWIKCWASLIKNPVRAFALRLILVELTIGSLLTTCWVALVLRRLVFNLGEVLVGHLVDMLIDLDVLHSLVFIHILILRVKALMVLLSHAVLVGLTASLIGLEVVLRVLWHILVVLECLTIVGLL
jgi:hypothetical protein